MSNALSIAPTLVSQRTETRASHQVAVERVIRHMRANLGELINLNELSRIAAISKFHFVRVFEEITGTTPHDFLASLRVQQAKELLLTTQASVTDICMEVGYSSLGSFSRIFTNLVGLSPTRFRTLRPRMDADFFAAAMRFEATQGSVPGPRLEGEIEASDERLGIIFVGAFTKGVPFGIPETGTVMLAPGRFSMLRPSTTQFHLLSVLLPMDSGLFVSSANLPTLLVASERCDVSGNSQFLRLSLRPARPTDPPILVALSALLTTRKQRPTVS